MENRIILDYVTLPPALRVTGTLDNKYSVGAAYNRQMHDRRDNTVFAYFDEAGELIAWSPFDAYTTEIGKIADGWPIYTYWRQFPERLPNGQIQELIIMLARKMEPGDL